MTRAVALVAVVFLVSCSGAKPKPENTHRQAAESAAWCGSFVLIGLHIGATHGIENLEDNRQKDAALAIATGAIAIGAGIYSCVRAHQLFEQIDLEERPTKGSKDDGG